MRLDAHACGLATFSHRFGQGWSAPLPDELNSPRTLVLAFGAPHYIDDPLAFAELRAAFPDSIITGCSTAGEILGNTLSDDTIAVAVRRFEHTPLSIASAPISDPRESFHAGSAIATQLSRQGLRAVLVFSDGLKVNGTELVRGLNNALPQGVVVSGGLAGDGSEFKQTWTLRQGAPARGHISAVGFYGPRCRFGHGCKGGWDVFGPERVVTKSEGNILFELDGKPALPLYKQYLGELARDLPASALLFPLCIREDAHGARNMVRTILAVDEARDALIFAGDIPERSLAQLMRANFDRLIDGAEESALMTNDSGHIDGPVLSIAVSCVGRRLVLGERAPEELERTMAVLAPGSAQIGFYSYGELSPFTAGGCDLHNQTMTITTISEA